MAPGTYKDIASFLLVNVTQSLSLKWQPSQANTTGSQLENLLHRPTSVSFLAGSDAWFTVMTTSRTVIVDDTDLRISYAGDWFLGIPGPSMESLSYYGPTFNHTLHGIKSEGSFGFSFNGTSFKIVGTYILNQDNGPQASWDCYVDGIKIASDPGSTVLRNHFTFCRYERLPSTEHHISFNITPEASTFLLDFIEFIPISGDSTGPAVVVVDNLDPGIEWGLGWEPYPSTTEVNMTTASGSAMQFDFVGTSVTWMSTDCPHGNLSHASYSIDGGEPVIFDIPSIPDNATSCLYNQPRFTTPNLPFGPHSLHVKYLGDENASPLVLDYLLVDNTTAPSSVDTTSSPSVNTASSTIQQVDLPTDSTHTGSEMHDNPSTSDESPEMHRTMVGLITGAVIGGVAVLGLIALSILFFLKRRSKKQRRLSIVPPESPLGPSSMSIHDDQAVSCSPVFVPAAPISPYILHPERTSFDASQLYIQNPTESGSQSSHLDAQEVGGSGLPRPMKPEGDGRPRKTSLYGPESRIAQHQDSGLRMEPPLVAVIEVPPVYTEG